MMTHYVHSQRMRSGASHPEVTDVFLQMSDALQAPVDHFVSGRNLRGQTGESPGLFTHEHLRHETGKSTRTLTNTCLNFKTLDRFQFQESEKEMSTRQHPVKVEAREPSWSRCEPGPDPVTSARSGSAPCGRAGPAAAAWLSAPCPDPAEPPAARGPSSAAGRPGRSGSAGPSSPGGGGTLD